MHHGIAYVGSVAVGSTVTDFTALGDTVNAAARMASEAAAGELLISESALANAGFDGSSLPRRELSLRGRETSLTAFVARAESLASLVAQAAHRPSSV